MICDCRNGHWNMGESVQVKSNFYRAKLLAIPLVSPFACPHNHPFRNSTGPAPDKSLSACSRAFSQLWFLISLCFFVVISITDLQSIFVIEQALKKLLENWSNSQLSHVCHGPVTGQKASVFCQHRTSKTVLRMNNIPKCRCFYIFHNCVKSNRIWNLVFFFFFSACLHN